MDYFHIINKKQILKFTTYIYIKLKSEIRNLNHIHGTPTKILLLLNNS